MLLSTADTRQLNHEKKFLLKNLKTTNHDLHFHAYVTFKDLIEQNLRPFEDQRLYQKKNVRLRKNTNPQMKILYLLFVDFFVLFCYDPTLNSHTFQPICHMDVTYPWKWRYESPLWERRVQKVFASIRHTVNTKTQNFQNHKEKFTYERQWKNFSINGQKNGWHIQNSKIKVSIGLKHQIVKKKIIL